MRGGRWVDIRTPLSTYQATNSRGHPNPRKKALSISYSLPPLPDKLSRPPKPLEDNSGNLDMRGDVDQPPLARTSLCIILYRGGRISKFDHMSKFEF